MIDYYHDTIVPIESRKEVYVQDRWNNFTTDDIIAALQDRPKYERKFCRSIGVQDAQGIGNLVIDLLEEYYNEHSDEEITR